MDCSVPCTHTIRSNITILRSIRSAFMLMSGGSQGLAHLCASTGVQGLFDPISTKKCLEEFSRHTEPKETSDRPSSVSLEHASVFHWNGYISKSKGRSSGSGSASWSSFSAFANGYWPFVTLTAARTAADSHCVPFSLRSIHFFPFAGKTGSAL